MKFSLKKVLVIEKKNHPIKEFLKKEKVDYIIWSIYRKLYENSVPSADFDLLFLKAKQNSNGQKEILYNNFKIKDEIAEMIIDKELSKFKLLEFEKRQIKTSVYLGCSPVFAK
jgi:hypothetical protein